MLYRELLLSLTPQEWEQIFSATLPSTHTHTHRGLRQALESLKREGLTALYPKLCSGQPPLSTRPSGPAGDTVKLCFLIFLMPRRPPPSAPARPFF